MEIPSVTDVVGLSSMTVLTIIRVAELTEDIARYGGKSVPAEHLVSSYLGKYSKPFLCLSAPLIIKNQCEAIYRLTSNTSTHFEEDAQLALGGVLMVANAVLPQYRLALYAAQVALDSYGIYSACQNNQSPEAIVTQLIFTILFNTGRNERAEIAEQFFNNKSSVTHFDCPNFGIQEFLADPIEWAPENLKTLNQVHKLKDIFVEDFEKYIQASATLKNLINPEVEIKITDGLGMSFNRNSRQIVIGATHHGWQHPSSFLIHLSHELAHANDELMKVNATSLFGHTEIARYAEGYAIDKQMRVASELYQKELHGGFNLEMGPRTLSSVNYLEQIKDNPDEVYEYIRQWVLEADFFRDADETRESYRARYERKYRGPKDEVDLTATAAQKEMIERAFVSLPYAGFDEAFRIKMEGLLDQAHRGEISASHVADALLEYQFKNEKIPDVTITPVGVDALRTIPQNQSGLSKELLDKTYNEVAPQATGSIFYHIKIDLPNVHWRNLCAFGELWSFRLPNNIQIIPNPEIQIPLEIYLPNSSFMEAWFRNCFNNPDAKFVYTFGQGASSLRFLQDLRKRNIYTIAHPWNDSWWGDINQNFSAWFLNYHDFYHVLDMSCQGRYYVELASIIIKTFDRLPTQIKQQPFAQYVIKVLVDMEHFDFTDYKSLLKLVWDPVYLHFIGSPQWPQRNLRHPRLLLNYAAWRDHSPQEQMMERYNHIAASQYDGPNKYYFDESVAEASTLLVEPFKISDASHEDQKAYRDFIDTFLNLMGDQINHPLLAPLKERIENDKSNPK